MNGPAKEKEPENTSEYKLSYGLHQPTLEELTEARHKEATKSSDHVSCRALACHDVLRGSDEVCSNNNGEDHWSSVAAEVRRSHRLRGHSRSTAASTPSVYAKRSRESKPLPSVNSPSVVRR